MYFVDGRAGGAEQCFLPCQTSGLFKADCDDVAEERQTLTVKRIAGAGGHMLGAKLADNTAVVRVSPTVNHDERVCIRLTKQIFSFVDLVCGVHGNENSTDLGGRPKCNIPLRYIGCPDCNMMTGPDTQSYECTCKRVDIVSELGISSCIIERCILECILIGKFLYHRIKYLWEGKVDQCFFFPNELARSRFVAVKRFFCFCGIVKSAHIVDEMCVNNINIIDIGKPFGFPFKRDKAIIVYRTQAVHHILDGELTVADKAIFKLASNVMRILDMNVLYVSAEIGDRCCGIFACGEICVIHIPKRAEIVGGKSVENIPELLGVRKKSYCFEQNGNAHLFRNRKNFFYAADSVYLVILVRYLCGVKSYVRNFEIACCFERIFDLFNIALKCRFVGKSNIASDIKARNRKSH